MGPVGEDERWKAFGPFHDYTLSSAVMPKLDPKQRIH